MRTTINLLLLYLASLCNCAYWIYDDRDIPSYLYGEVIDIDETQNFPKKIEINMTLTPSIGTLLFGEDSIGNQIVVRYNSWIVTHAEQAKPYIQIVYRGKDYGQLYLSEFCGCKYNCLYQSINLGIGVSRNTIAMLCNNVNLKGDYISDKKEGFKGYPRININKNGIKGNKAVFYIGNYFNINGKGHDLDQIGGCIYSVSYMEKPIKMKEYGNGATFGRCDKRCTDPSICNGGTCFETFSSAPLLCDCTNSLGSGSDCSIMPKRENKILYGTFTPKAVKVVWKTNDREIIRMKGKKYIVSIKVDYEQLRLKFTQQGYHTILYKILDNYVVFSYHIMIIKFYDTYIEVEFPLLNKSERLNVHTKVDNLIFSKLYLFSSNDGVIDVQQKAALDNIVWFSFDESSTVSMDKPKVSVTSTTTQQTTQTDTTLHNNNYTTTTISMDKPKVSVTSTTTQQTIQPDTILHKLINKTHKTHMYNGISKSATWTERSVFLILLLILIIVIVILVWLYVRQKRRNKSNLYPKIRRNKSNLYPKIRRNKSNLYPKIEESDDEIEETNIHDKESLNNLLLINDNGEGNNDEPNINNTSIN